MIESVSIIGSGQVGTSIALALTQKTSGMRISMTDANAATFDLVKIKFMEAGISPLNISFRESAKQAAADSDLVILATPISTFGSVIEDIKPAIRPGTIVTDMGSAKIQAISTINDALAGTDISYVPAHPGNGCQGNGPMSARVENILGPTSWMFLVHDPETDAHNSTAISAVRDFWEKAGVQVAETDPVTHDRFFGTCSHLQHAIAFSMMNMARDDERLLDTFSAGGTTFRNLTRLALSRRDEGQPSPLVRMWQPIFMQNRDMILASTGPFTDYFRTIVDLAGQRNTAELTELLEEAHDFRSDVFDPEPRENILGEFADIMGENDSGSLRKRFDQKAMPKLYNNLLLPIAIANAQTLNARDVSADLVRDKANPSFRDGTAACLFDPFYTARLLISHSGELGRSAARFQDSLDRFTSHLRREDQEGIADFIQSAQDLRAPLPGARKGSDTREEYLLQFGLNHMII